MRKSILALCALALGAFGFTSVAAPTQTEAQTVEGPKVTWRLSLWGKRRAFTEGLEYVSAEVAQRTAGNFQIKLYYGRQLSKPKENLDGISIGAFEAALFSAAYHPSKNKPLNVLDLPFLPLGDLGLMLKVHNVIYDHPAAKKALARWNAHLYMPNILPQHEIVGKGNPPASVSDFKGMRLRALGGMGRAVKAIGAVPITVAASETYTALLRGTVDAAVVPLATISAYKLDEVADWYTTNMSLGTVTCPIVFNNGRLGQTAGPIQGVAGRIEGARTVGSYRNCFGCDPRIVLPNSRGHAGSQVGNFLQPAKRKKPMSADETVTVHFE